MEGGRVVTNLQLLINRKAALILLPPGSSEGLGALVQAMLSPGVLSDAMKAAREWVTQAIQAVRSAKEPNPYKDWTDEQIATEIMNRIPLTAWERCRGR